MRHQQLGFLLTLTLLAAARAQAPDAPFRVTVNLVQVDAVVTDRSELNRFAVFSFA